MNWFQNFSLSLLCIVQLMNLSSVGASECRGNSSNKHQISLSLNSVRNDEGEWETSYLALQNTTNLPRNIDVNITRSFVTCEGNHIIQIGGYLKDMHQEQTISTDRPRGNKLVNLYFKRYSNNTAVINNGRTLQKLKLDDYGAGVTNRHLMDDEIFTVRIDKINPEDKDGPAIGLTELNVDSRDLQDHFYRHKNGTWMFYYDDLYHNGKIIKENCLPKSLQNVQVGQTIGVMRSRFGKLSLFIDGNIQGQFESNIPNNVYGVFELFHSATRATVVDA